ncbi:MAG TPA: serine hydrolase domain-containing protein [Thermoanaerobaculia bacterium]|jgi:CubicO group peptidase (beta-lactamase class C family)
MIRRPAALVLALFLVATVEARPRRSVATGPRFDVPAARTAVQAAMAHGAPGAIVAVRHRGATYVEAFGLLDKEAATPMRWDDVLPIGSVSKQFTSAALMRLVEEGRIRVTDPIRMYLPELDARYEPVTIEQMLTHTAGLPEYGSMLPDLYTPMSQSQMLALITSRPLGFPPGTAYSYSNSGYYFGAMIVERVTGQRFDLFLEERFFAPLAMTATSECGSETPDGYARSPFDGSVSRIAPMHASMLIGAGALCSSVSDLLQWNQALTGGLSVSPQSYTRMRSDLRLNSGASLPYGYGLGTDALDGKLARVWHNGQIPGFMAHLAWYPDHDLSIAVLVNISAGRFDYPTDIANAIARSLAPSTP